MIPGPPSAPPTRVLVTGATDGIGKETAVALARRGAQVILHGRNLARLRDSREEVANRAALPVDTERLEIACFDLASLASIRYGAAELLAHHDRLDVLLHNAGVFEHKRHLTRDGFESTFAVNHLAPFLLTHLLLPALERAYGGHGAPYRDHGESPGVARVITVSSIAHTQGRIDWDNLDGTRAFSGYAAYAQSKLANVLFAAELAARLDPARVTSNSLHPGVIDTKLLRDGFGVRGASLAEGAATSVHLALSPACAAITGRYFVDQKLAATGRNAEDRESRRRLFEVSADLCGIPIAERI